jgi:HK97 family phage portal protein
MTGAYDSRADTLAHISRVRDHLGAFVRHLLVRAEVHDQSKLSEPEKPAFDRETPKLKTLVFGSDDYKASLAALGPALQHHYSANSHHPEHYEDGIAGMDLMDLVGAGAAWNFWQQGYDPAPAIQSSAILEACVSAYAQTIAMCPGDHWRTQANGGRERITTSALSRILRQPNTYQGSSDFLLGLVRSLYAEGNAYALARRNVRFEVTELHLMSPSASAASVAENGEIFYSLGGNAVAERIFGFPIRGVPARDVLHVRLNTGYDPLRGQSPFASALLDGALGTAMQRQALHFYGNRSVPSGVLSTDQVLNREQMDQMAERWREKSQGLGAGDVPILAAGIKFQSVAASAKDMEFAAVMKMTQENIALAYRVPLQILGIGATPFASTEALMASWKASGLGFAVNHVEQAFDRLFRLPGRPD